MGVHPNQSQKFQRVGSPPHNPFSFYAAGGGKSDWSTFTKFGEPAQMFSAVGQLTPPLLLRLSATAMVDPVVAGLTSAFKLALDVFAVSIRDY